jgi:YHS domain-containing protein
MTPIGRNRRLPAGLLVMVLLAVPAAAGRVASAAEIVNATAAGIAVDGFDTVAYFELGRPTKGRAELSIDYKGVRWLFATPTHRNAFIADPERYAPKYNGFCAVAVSEGAAAEVDFVNGWAIVDGALYMNWSADVKRIFLAELPERLPASRKNWPDVHFDMQAGIRQIARHADFPEEGIVHPQGVPAIMDGPK